MFFSNDKIRFVTKSVTLLIFKYIRAGMAIFFYSCTSINLRVVGRRYAETSDTMPNTSNSITTALVSSAVAEQDRH